MSVPPQISREDLLKNGCIMPFIGTCISAGGKFKPCCKYSTWSSTPNARDVDLKTLISSEHFQKIREDFLAGREHEGCKRCFKDESSGIKSMRESYNRLYANLLEEEDLTHPKVKLIDFGFGNVCNAACITCDSAYSSQWIKDEKALVEIGKNKFSRRPSQVFQDSFLWTDQDIQNLKVISHAQNETLINPELVKFLERAKTLGGLEGKRLELCTNGQHFPKVETIENILSFGEVELQFSIDGLRAKNDYIRHPLNFSIIEANIGKWVNLANHHKNLKIICRCTISIYNFLYIKELVDWWEGFRKQTPSGAVARMQFGYALHPTYLSPTILPEPIKNLAYEFFPEKIIKGLGSRTPADLTQNSLELFFEFTKTMDERRNLNAFQTFPLLMNILEPYRIGAVQ